MFCEIFKIGFEVQNIQLTIIDVFLSNFKLKSCVSKYVYRRVQSVCKMIK